MWNQNLADIAQEHAMAMASRTAPFSHDGFDQRRDRVSFPCSSFAENLAYNHGVYEVAKVAVNGWIESSGHRKNLLGLFDVCGIGVSRSSSDGSFYLTQLFARTR
jgi:uncharacterized protein YkwD